MDVEDGAQTALVEALEEAEVECNNNMNKCINKQSCFNRTTCHRQLHCESEFE